MSDEERALAPGDRVRLDETAVPDGFKSQHLLRFVGVVGVVDRIMPVYRGVEVVVHFPGRSGKGRVRHDWVSRYCQPDWLIRVTDPEATP